jgi:hypothetical protein
MRLCYIGIIMMVIMHPSQPDCYPEDEGSMFLRNILTNLYYTVWKSKKKKKPGNLNRCFYMDKLLGK